MITLEYEEIREIGEEEEDEGKEHWEDSEDEMRNMREDIMVVKQVIARNCWMVKMRKRRRI